MFLKRTEGADEGGRGVREEKGCRSKQRHGRDAIKANEAKEEEEVETAHPHFSPSLQLKRRPGRSKQLTVGEAGLF